jgi:pre-rRNA-processing protein TSR2
MDERLTSAVRVVFGEWTALKLAVENEWGGHDTRQKALQLLDDVLHHLHANKTLHADDLELSLVQALADDFNVEAEDGSPNQVAHLLTQLHREASAGATTTADQLLARAGATRSWVDLAPPRPVRDPNESSSDEEAEDDGDGADALEAMETTGEMRERHEPQVDDDGFQMVTRSGRSRRR